MSKIIEYKYKKGECLCEIAKQFHTSTYKICIINRFNKYRLYRRWTNIAY